MKVQTNIDNNIVTMVDELINPTNSSWDEDLVRSIFWPMDAYQILQIPITSGREEVVGWHHNKNKLFWVRSA